MIFFEEYFVASLFIASAIYWLLIPEKYRLYFIIVYSISALLFVQPIFTLVIFLMVLALFYSSKRMLQLKSRSKNYFVYGLISLVAFLLVGKYAGSLLEEIFVEEVWFMLYLLVPLGISYLSLKIIAYYIDVYRGQISDPSLADLMALIFFLPTFPAGPIERYQRFKKNHTEEISPEFYIEGLRRIAIGFFKKVVIANYILGETLINKVQPIVVGPGAQSDLSAALILAFLMGALIYAYIDLSAYADLAIGFGRLFGYEISENMNYPLFQSNLSDYWSRWHMTLSGWCRDNVYFPVLGATRNNVLALYASFSVMGLWHNLSLNWLMWGVWHATGITVFSKWASYKRRLIRKTGFKLPDKAAYSIGVCITCLYSACGFSFILFDTGPYMLENTLNALKLLSSLIL